MSKVIEWLKGKKTYITALVVGICAALNALGIIIPEWVYLALGALGLGSLRAGLGSK